MRAFWLTCLLGLFASSAFAEGVERPLVHVVREGETLAAIAERYYGDARREKVLVMDNGLHIEGGIPIVPGMRLHIPSVTFHRVVPGETWNVLAVRYFGDARRAAELVAVNRADSRAPDPGAVIVVPYPLRHIVTQSEDLVDIARLYYDDGERVDALRRFNGLRGGGRLERGQVVLVPLATLTLRAQESAPDEAAPATDARGVRAEQERIAAELPTLREHVRRGRYLEAVALGHRWLGGVALTQSLRVNILREIATAYVALARPDLAERAFDEILALDGSFSLDARRTSPRVLEALRRASERRAAAPSTP